MLEAHDSMLRCVAHGVLHTHQYNGCISSNSLLTISLVLTIRTSALRVADKGPGFVFVLACGHGMLQSNYGVKTVRCASGPNFVCPSSCSLQDPDGAFHESSSVCWVLVETYSNPQALVPTSSHTAAHSELYREPPNEANEMERHKHA
jgi:hypothetical protein